MKRQIVTGGRTSGKPKGRSLRTAISTYCVLYKAGMAEHCGGRIPGQRVEDSTVLVVLSDGHVQAGTLPSAADD